MSSEYIRKQVEKLIHKSREAMSAAESLLNNASYCHALYGCYHAMFFLAEAALLTRGVERFDPMGELMAFDEHFVRSGLIEERLYLALKRGYTDKSPDYFEDYEDFEDIERKEALLLMNDAQEFNTVLETFLKKWLEADMG
jgi:uncharacterized protein (UPF0332 family)